MASRIDVAAGADAGRGVAAGADKSPDAFRTISEAAEDLGLPQHVLRFWETRFPQIKPLKRGGGRRYYRPDDVELLRAVKHLLYGEGYTIKGVQRLFKEQGARAVVAGAFDRGEDAGEAPAAPDRPDSVPPPPADRQPTRASAPPAPGRGLAGLCAADLQALRAALADIAEGERILTLARVA
jgi:DNA-binding transcriptional MerR regulator